VNPISLINTTVTVYQGSFQDSNLIDLLWSWDFSISTYLG